MEDELNLAEDNFEGKQTPFKGEDIIIIEDDEVTAEALEELLKEEGYGPVMVCNRGKDGLDYIESGLATNNYPGLL